MGARVAAWVGVVCLLTAELASANVFDMGGPKSLEFVTVGDRGNGADTLTGCGSVGYTYQMGKYDVTAGQYCQFLNAVAGVSDPCGLYNPYMADTSDICIGCGITRSGDSGAYRYDAIAGRENFPANYITWCAAARFCNWLSNGQQGAGTTETGSYTLNGVTGNSGDAVLAVTRNPGATYVIPTEEEWYKAAYYKGGGTNAGYWLYPTRSNDAPSNVLSTTGTNNANYWVGNWPNGNYTDPTNYLTPVMAFESSPSAYGTFDQGGNVYQWNEGSYGSWHNRLGGSFYSFEGDLQATNLYYNSPTHGSDVDTGFRVALVPEPASLAVLALGGVGMLCRRRSPGR